MQLTKATATAATMMLLVIASACGNGTAADEATPPAPAAPSGTPAGDQNPASSGPSASPGDSGSMPGGGFSAADVLPPLRGEDEVLGADLVSGPCAELILFQEDVMYTVMEADAYFTLGETYNYDVSARRLTNLYEAIPSDQVDDDVRGLFEQVTLRLTILRDSNFQPTGSPGDHQAIQQELAAGGYDDAAFMAGWQAAGARMFEGDGC